MPKRTLRANARTLPDDEPRFRIAHLFRDRSLKTALGVAENDLGPIPVLPTNKNVEKKHWGGAAGGSDAAANIFYLAYWKMRAEEARRKLIEAEFCVAWASGVTDEELAALHKAEGISLARYKEALASFASVPAMSRNNLKMKEKLIGKLWLLTNAVCRDAIAKDEAYLERDARAVQEKNLEEEAPR